MSTSPALVIGSPSCVLISCTAGSRLIPTISDSGVGSGVGIGCACAWALSLSLSGIAAAAPNAPPAIPPRILDSSMRFQPSELNNPAFLLIKFSAFKLMAS